MKALWIRVEAHDVDSRDISRFAVALGVSKVMALGHSTALAGAIAEHTDDGRIDTVTDEELEQWSRWGGKGGRLAKAVRDHLQAPDGTYRDWTETMGQLVERRAKDRDRKRLEKEARERSRQPSLPGFHGTSTEAPRTFHGVSSATERNGTERDDTGTAKEHKAESTEGNNGNRSASLRSKSGTATAGSLPPTASRFLDRFYPVAGRRRADVKQQLERLAAGHSVKAPVPGYEQQQPVSAYSVERLEAKCAEVIAESSTIHDLNAAIAILFAKLNDTSDGQTPGQLAAAAHRAPDPEVAEIDTWMHEHPREVESIRRELTAGGPVDAFADVALDAQVRAKVRRRLHPAEIT